MFSGFVQAEHHYKNKNGDINTEGTGNLRIEGENILLILILLKT